MKAKKTENLKKISALLLALIMIIQLFMPKTYVALATDSDNYNKSVSQENDMSISGTDSFGTMLADELSDEVEEQNNNNGCNIFEVKIEENTAVVNFETRQDAVLIVGIYTEDGSRMVASGIMDVIEGETSAFVDIEAELPDYYLIKSFLVDTEDYSPLCTSYESSYYTKEMQDLLEKTTDDFEESKVLNLDDDKTNNFAVYSDEVKLIELKNAINKVVSENGETGTYVIENADATVTSLKAGDIFAGTKANGEELIVKVKSIKKNGTTVTITSDDTSLDEVFDYVKIDAEAGLDKAEVDNSSCGEGVIYKGKTEWKDETQTYAFAGEGNVSTGLSYELVEKEVGNDAIKGKVSGSVDLKIEASAEVYITLSYQYIELKLEYELKIGVEFSGEINGKIPLGYVKLSPIPVLNIDFTPSFVFEAETKLEINATVKGSIGFAYDSETGGRNISSTPDIDFEIQVEGRIFIGLSLEPKVEIINERVASAKLEAKLGAEATLMPADEESSTSKHECKKCLEGEVYGKLEIEFEVKALNLEKLTWKTKFEIKGPIIDFYFSFDKMEFGFGICPYVNYEFSGKYSISLGSKHSGVITKEGDLYMWGDNSRGQLGNGSKENSLEPVKVLSGIKSVSLGATHSGAITKEGDLYMWGDNSRGQLGNGSKVDSLKPVKILSGVKSVSLGDLYSGAITEEGDLYMWGNNSGGQLGNGSKDNSYEPIKVLSGVKSVSLGGGHSGAITEEGDLYMWGIGYQGVLGNGSTIGSLEPIKVLSGVKSVSLGNSHSGAITEEGDLYMWGSNSNGQLGNGNRDNSYEPVKVLSGVKNVSLGYSHSGAITEGGDLYMWGLYGLNTQLLSGNDVESVEPIKVLSGVKTVSLGDYHSGAITEEGNLYMWGSNRNGQLGNGSKVESVEPIKVLSGVKTVSLGNYHSGAITEEGDLYMWGDNSNGQLGNGSKINSLQPVKVLSGVKSLSLGATHSGAITEKGDLYMWGDNWKGELGNGSTQDSLKPVKILSGVKSLSLGYHESGAITEEGDLYMWGYYGYKTQLLNGSKEYQVNPVKVLSGVRSVNLGSNHRGAITEEGDLYMWGDNSNGQLGNGSKENSLEPVKVLSGVKSVSLGGYYSGAITEEGDLYMWGDNSNGQLGNGSKVDSLEPVKVLSGVKSVCLGHFHSGAITEEGDLYMWGNNSYGQLGNGSKENSLEPVKILLGVKSLSLSYSHSGAITEEGDLYMWGDNSYGQLGNGSAANYGEPIKIMENIKLLQEINDDSDVFTLKRLYFMSVQLSHSEYNKSTIASNFNNVLYESLVTNKEYLFYVIKSEEGDILASDNLLYIAQGKADEDGKLTFTYNLAENLENKIEKLSGAGKFDTGEVNALQGDVNGDGEIDIKDSALIKRYLAGADVELDLKAADVNGDGEVNIKDSALIKRQLAGWE